MVPRSGERLRLHDVPGRQVLRPRPAGAVEHLAVVPARREDRRAGTERRRQVDGPEDHGRARGALERDRRACPGRDGRDARPGARARSREERARERRGRRARAARPARPLQRRLREVRRARRGLRCAPRRAVQGAGADRPARCLEPRRDARPGDGRAAPPGGRPRRDDAFGRRAPPGRTRTSSALLTRPAAPRRADEPSRRRVGRLARALPRVLQGHGRRGHPRSLLPRQRRGLDPRARPRQGASRSRATTPPGSSRSRLGSPSRRRRSRRGGARWRASSSGCG